MTTDNYNSEIDDLFLYIKLLRNSVSEINNTLDALDKRVQKYQTKNIIDTEYLRDHY